MLSSTRPHSARSQRAHHARWAGGEPLAKPIERFEPNDWKARTRFGALMSGLRQFGERARGQADDLTHAITDVQPDVLFIDEGAWGAAAVAERSGLPWAFPGRPKAARRRA
jgi:hypothetical protein